MKKDLSRLSLVAAMFIFGTIGIFRRYIPLPSSVIAMVRGFIGATFLALVMLLRRKKPDLASVRKKLLPLILSGAAIGFNWILLFEAYTCTTIPTATLCYYMAPVIVILLSPVVLHERITLRKGLCSLCAVIGIVLISGGGVSPDGGDLRGIAFGLGAAALYAAVILTNRTLAAVPTYEKTILQLFFAAFTLIPYVLFTEDLSALHPTSFAVLMLVTVGIVHTGITYALYFGAIGRIPAQTAAILSYIDPVVAILLSTLLPFLGDEPMGLRGALGTVLILGGALVSELRFDKKEADV